MRTGNRRDGIRMAFVAAALALAAGCASCKTDDPSDKTNNCTENADCDPGFYCGDDDKCVQDCDPSATDPGCPDGQSCDSLGRCVVEGECVVDDDCDSPPGETTCDGDTLVAYSETGSCDTENGETVCNYTETRTACENGCLGGECIPDPCDQLVCDTAPPPVCDPDGFTLISFTEPGVCLEGVCDYDESRASCAAGCLNGVCLAGACDTTTCNRPPANECDGETAVRYEQMGTCVDNMGQAFCDYMPEFEDCLYTGATCNNAACENPLTQVGPLVIVEYQANPAGSFNDLAEWFEILNTSNAPVNLDGWTIRSMPASGTTPEEHVIAGLGEIAAGARMVFVFSSAVSFPYAYNYDTARLANNTDSLALVNAAGEVSDYIYYEPGSVLTGRSRKLNPTVAPDPNMNDSYANWCPSMGDEYATSPSNYGTPGSENTACAADPCAGFSCEPPQGFCLDGENKAVQYVNNNAMCMTSRLNNPYCDFETMEVQCTDGTQLCAFGVCETIPANVPKPGELIFTEFMGNPESTDTDREWFEVYNTTGGDLSMFSVIFSDNDMGGANDSYQFLDINATIPANGYVAFARNTDPLLNGGVSGASLYSGAHLKNDPNEATPFKLKLTQYDGTLIDESFYDNPTTLTSALPSGRSIQLDPDALTDTGNDQQANWCFGATVYGDGGRGTPGAANEQCP